VWGEPEVTVQSEIVLHTQLNHFLNAEGYVPGRHIVAPGAMGEYGAAAPNETKAGRAENRRVEVKALVNKGIAGS
jgi:OOP family OmpA-OmpF porin